MKFLFYLLCFCVTILQIHALESVWQWKCEGGYCVKKQITDPEESTSFAECHQICANFSGLFPAPTGKVQVSKNLTTVKKVTVLTPPDQDSPISKLVKTAEETIFHKLTNTTDITTGVTLELSFKITDPNTNRLTMKVDESYKISVTEKSGEILSVQIDSGTNYGFRHALETMNQLIIYDDLRNVLKIARTVTIEDQPKFAHRGISLDTARNFISIEVLERIIQAMGASKMNAFHWHITDSQSFPYVSKGLPQLSKFGAYSPKKVYTSQEIRDFVAYANEYGVKVIPEFDAPAHVGEGWQDTGLVTCFNWQPWDKFCVQAPCGQFDPTQDKLYDVLGQLFSDMVADFDPEIFHMGGDEVHFGCWNHTENIVEWMKEKGWGTNESDFIKLWNHYQQNSLKKLQEVTGTDMKFIMWTSTLTHKNYFHHLPNDKYILQVWTDKNDESIRDLLENNYTLIMSNYDSLYLDCGYGSWVGTGNNWCSPYSGWTKIYDNDYKKIAGDRVDQIIGAEVVMWTEQVDELAVESKIWPRAAALAERLWSDPVISNYKDAEQRMLVHRERLADLGVRADALEPEWCMQNEEQCPFKGGGEGEGGEEGEGEGGGGGEGGGEGEGDGDGGTKSSFDSFVVFLTITFFNCVIYNVR